MYRRFFKMDHADLPLKSLYVSQLNVRGAPGGLVYKYRKGDYCLAMGGAREFWSFASERGRVRPYDPVHKSESDFCVIYAPLLITASFIMPWDSWILPVFRYFLMQIVEKLLNRLECYLARM